MYLTKRGLSDFSELRFYRVASHDGNYNGWTETTGRSIGAPGYAMQVT
jgi:hypothetical protein